ncbi:MAG: outer rane lipoprotein, lipocalin family [Deltaproteobacteria bacterium]|nr:outer rane lipoprotein, lipocalin family [Deltaproteobacteria bacterium]
MRCYRKRGKHVLPIIRGIISSILLIVTGCTYMDKEPSPPLETVSHVDLGRYMGKWYEIARYPNSFQEGCVGSMATYTLMNDGRVSVLNECNDGSFRGKLRSAKGKAWIVDKETNAKLKVSFFWPFAGDYWILEIDNDYSYVVVGHPKRKYLWILSRNKIMEDVTYEGILGRLAKIHHYDISKLIKTIHE